MEKINNKQYLTYLIDQYQNLIFSICYQYTQNYFEAEDLSQETFISAFKNLDSFDRKYEKAWLAQIASNKCKDYLKSAARRVAATPDEELDTYHDGNQGPEEQVLEDDVKTHLKSACESLKSPYREVAMDYFYHEKEVAEIADTTGKNTKTIQTQIYRARAQLRELYGKEPAI